MKTHTHKIEKKRDMTTDTQCSPLVAHIYDPDNARTKETVLPRKLDDARSGLIHGDVSLTSAD